MCARSPKPAWSAPAPTGSRSWRCSAIRWELRSRTPGSCRATRRASAGALGRFITNNFLTPEGAVGEARQGRCRAVDRGLARRSRQREERRPTRGGGGARGGARAAARRHGRCAGPLPRRRPQGGARATGRRPTCSASYGRRARPRSCSIARSPFAETALIANKAFIRARVEANSSRWVPRWLDGIVADKITSTVAADADRDARPRPSLARRAQGRHRGADRALSAAIRRCRPMSRRRRMPSSTIPASPSTSR